MEFEFEQRMCYGLCIIGDGENRVPGDQPLECNKNLNP